MSTSTASRTGFDDLGLEPEALAACFAAAIRSSRDGLALVDAAGIIQWCSPQFEAIASHPAGGLVGASVDVLVDEDEDSLLAGSEAGDGGDISSTCRIRCGDGSTVLVHTSLASIASATTSGVRWSLWVRDLESDDNDDADLAAADGDELLHFSDAMADLEHSTTHDPLTDVSNRAAILVRLMGMEPSTQFGVLAIDIDDFRRINTETSHAHGDEVIRRVATRLTTNVRRSDLGRIAGDEFLVIACDIQDAEDLSALAERLVTSVSGMHLDGELSHPVTVSIGASLSRPDATADDMLHEAQVALERARSAGGERWTVFDDSLLQHGKRADVFGDELREALDTERIATWYQPIMDMISGTCVGWEALARWLLPDGTARPAKHFIDAAADSGTLPDLGRLVARDAVRRAAQAPRGTFVGINVDPSELGRSLVDGLMEMLEHYGADPSRLALEIKADTLPELDDAARDMLRSAADRGIVVCVDNLSADPAALELLEDLPVGTVKLDRSVTSALGTAPGSELHHTLGGMAAALRARGIHTVAEGIEDRARAFALRDAGWRWGQGYLFGPPAPALAGHLPQPRQNLDQVPA